MWWKTVQNLLIFVYFFVKEAAKLILENLPYLRNDNAVYKAILKPVYWFGIPNSGSETLKSVKVKLSKNRQITVHALVAQSTLSVLFCFPYTRLQLAFHKHLFFFSVSLFFRRAGGHVSYTSFFTSLRLHKVNKHNFSAQYFNEQFTWETYLHETGD